MPFLSNLFGGGAAGLLTSAAKVIDETFTSKEERLQLEFEMQKAAFEYECELQRLQNASQELVLKDVANARQREVQILQSDKGGNLIKNISPILAILATALCFGMFYLLLFSPAFLQRLQVGQRDMVLYVLGILSALLTQVYGYYFGSSISSSDKNKTISDTLLKK